MSTSICGALLALTLAITGLTFLTVPAQADTAGCVTRAEYRAVSKGTTRARVHQIFDTAGKRLFINRGRVTNEGREYRVCGHPRSGGSFVQVQYNNYRLGGGPLRVSFKQLRIYG